MAYNTILLKGENANFEEITANAAITPGMLVEEMTTGLLRAHATRNGNAAAMFAMESEYEGKGIDENYAAGEEVRVWHPKKGDQVNALLADGESVAIGDMLGSNGDGFLKEIKGGDSAAEDAPASIVAKAKEAVDRSTSSGGDTNTTGRIVVEII
jgi:hypothetical protein